MSQVELINICKEYDVYDKSSSKLKILDNINACFINGKSSSIIGKSGTGKSTLLQLIGLLDKPTGGRILIDNKDSTVLSSKEKALFRNRHLGFIFQANLLLEDFSALENIMTPALIGGLDYNESKAKALELIYKIGLENRKEHFPSQLSGGEKQRIAIARALINNPDLILADEPTGSLDEENAKLTEDLLLKLVKETGKTLILVTHNTDFAKRCDCQFILENHCLRQEI